MGGVNGSGYGSGLNHHPYCLALAILLSILFPVRKVKRPMIARYFKVVNMFYMEESGVKYSVGGGWGK